MPVIEPDLWPFLLLGVVAAATWVLFARERSRLFIDREIAWLIWHWFSGGPLDVSRSEATSLRRRLGLAVLRMPPLLVVGPRLTAILVLGALVLAKLSICVAVNQWWIRPVAAAVRPYAGWPKECKSRLPWKNGRPYPARKFVKFKRTGGHWGIGLKVCVSPEFTLPNKEPLVEAVRTRANIDLGDVDHRWHLVGRNSCVTFEPSLRIPERVAWTDRDGTANKTVRELVEGTPAGVVWLGLGRDGVQVSYDLNRHPHVLISGPTGGGKSAVARSIAVQLMAQDPECEVVNLDAKHLSQLWLRDLPGCRSLHNLPEISDTLIELGDEVRNRVAHADSLPRREVEPYVAGLARKVLIVEEAPTLMAELDAWWQSEHGRVACPAVQNLRMMLNMSRVAGFNILGLAQRADASAMGGGLARENYVLRILVNGYTRRAWDMLVPEVDYVPSLDRDGWAMVCHGANGIETQCLYITDDEAEAWVAETRGLVESNVQTTKSPAEAPQTAPPSPATQSAEERSSPEDTKDDIELVTLRQAVEREVLPTSLPALQRAVGRAKKHGTFIPVSQAGFGPDGDKYLVEALVRWWDQRPRASAKKANYKPLVYFINTNGPAKELRYGGTVKIGMTTNLDQRLDSFAAHPDQVVKTIECKDEPSMKALEAEHHERWEEKEGDNEKSLRIFADRELFRVEGALASYLGVHGP